MVDKGLSSWAKHLVGNEEELFRNFLSLVDKAQYNCDDSMTELWHVIVSETVQTILTWDEEEDGVVDIAAADFLRSDLLRQFGVRLADKGRDAGEAFGAFFALFKLIRQSFVDFLNKSPGDLKVEGKLLATLFSIFDAIEMPLATRWQQADSAHLMKELRRSRYQLLHEKRRYFIVFQRMAEPAFVVDDNLQLLDVNQAFERFFGVSSREMLDRGCCDVLGQDVCRACALEKALKEQSSFSNIEVNINVKGEKKAVLINGTFLGDINREFPGILVILKDITEKKAIEKALKESEEKYRSLVENVPDAVWRADETGALSFISPNISKICGYSPLDFKEGGLAGSSFIHPEDADVVWQEFQRFFLLAGKGEITEATQQSDKDETNSYDVRYRFLTADRGWIWLHDRAGIPFIKDGIWCADGVVSDITALKKVEEELAHHRSNLAELVEEKIVQLRASNTKLIQEVAEREKAEKELTLLATRLQRSNRELEQFAHVASHDLKEPLILIVAFCEKLLDRCYLDLDKRGRGYLDRIYRSARKMQTLIEDLLQLSRISRSERVFETIDLNSLLRDVIDDFEEQIKKVSGNIKVGLLHELEGDSVQVRQLFQNIIANALKFRQENRTPVIQISSRLLADGLCEITVEDNGIGFNEKYLCRIFNPFERLHSYSQYEGTGIGLATCSSIAMRHGGQITARSTPGKGSIFIIRLPQCHKDKE